MAYKESQCDRQKDLIENSEIFDGKQGGGEFRGKAYDFVLEEPEYNIFEGCRDEALKYFSENGFPWWNGSDGKPTGHTFSSQVACVNHLLPIMKDKEAVLAVLNGVRNEFEDVLPIPCDKDPQYIGFEVVSKYDHLNEIYLTRGSNCTSIDAMILGKHSSGKTVMAVIEWKYTESYGSEDKSAGKSGVTRMARYNALIDASTQLKSRPVKSLQDYAGTIYYQEPYYQLMRQTLWAENVVAHKHQEDIKADDFIHIHVVPAENAALLKNSEWHRKHGYRSMHENWTKQLNDKSKYVLISPERLMEPVVESGRYGELVKYLSVRYW